MTEASSPVLDFYPVNFDTDLNGKQQDWEAVVLIPFIEEVRYWNIDRVDLTMWKEVQFYHGHQNNSMVEEAHL